jgi:hypothetical protein
VSVKLYGTAWDTEQRIQVNYWWLTGPLALHVMITIFLFATIIKTRNTPIWKSSALSLLDAKDPQNRLSTRKATEAQAREVTMRLEGNGGHWFLSESSRSEKGSLSSHSA